MNKENRIRTVLMGLGFGKRILENELILGSGKEYIDVIGVCDTNPDRLNIVIEKYGIKAYKDIDEILQDDNVEAVIIITGPVGRADLIDRVISTGRSVMTTKPFEASSEKTLRVLQKAKDLKVTVFMNSPSPTPTAELKKIKQWIDEYDLGRLVAYRATAWCSYREKPDGSWYDSVEQCPAAPIYRLGVYLLNDLCHFTAPAKKVHVMQSRLFTMRPTADNAQISLLHEDGVLGYVYASFCIKDKQTYRNTIELNYERGTIYKNVGLMREEDEISLQISAFKDGNRLTEEAVIASLSGSYQWKEFYQSVRGEYKEDTISPESVASVIHIMEEMKKQCLIEL